LIEHHIRRYFPAYTPQRMLAIRDGGDSGQFTEALLLEGSFEKIAPYAISIRKVLQEKGEFLRYRGTLKSIRMALSWVGIQNFTFRRLSPTTYELDPGLVPNQLQLKAINTALELSAPARGTLTRIFHGDFEVKYV
jgi:hypothetical protein